MLAPLISPMLFFSRWIYHAFFLLTKIMGKFSSQRAAATLALVPGSPKTKVTLPIGSIGNPVHGPS